MQTIDNSALQTIEAFVGQDQFVKYKGKAIFLNSWASWCPACIKEFPALNSIGKSCAGDSNIACVSYCSDLQTITEVDSFKNSRNLQLTFEDVISKSGLRMSLRKLAVEQLKISNVDTSLDLVPLNVIVDKLGNIVYYNSAISYEDTSKILALLKGN
jgi:thiol-disulfide isomerase/thioredoxin